MDAGNVDVVNVDSFTSPNEDRSGSATLHGSAAGVAPFSTRVNVHQVTVIWTCDPNFVNHLLDLFSHPGELGFPSGPRQTMDVQVDVGDMVCVVVVASRKVLAFIMRYLRVQPVATLVISTSAVTTCYRNKIKW